MGDAFDLPIGVVVTSKPHRASRASSLRGINGIRNRTAAAASSFAPYPFASCKCSPFISIAFAVSMVKVALCFGYDVWVQPSVLCRFRLWLLLEPRVWAEPFNSKPFFPEPFASAAFFAFSTSLSSPFFPRGRFSFSRRAHTEPFSVQLSITAVLVSKSSNDASSSNSGRTTLTKKNALVSREHVVEVLPVVKRGDRKTQRAFLFALLVKLLHYAFAPGVRDLNGPHDVGEIRALQQELRY
mmetsp:Transcript_9048/g.33739  ORF Transcript_9048/g.33739 Transcript_9048/m.33739 type:complete len:241 (-) Transcript_9048:903-1625(-)